MYSSRSQAQKHFDIWLGIALPPPLPPGETFPTALTKDVEESKLWHTPPTVCGGACTTLTLHPPHPTSQCAKKKAFSQKKSYGEKKNPEFGGSRNLLDFIGAKAN